MKGTTGTKGNKGNTQTKHMAAIKQHALCEPYACLRQASKESGRAPSYDMAALEPCRFGPSAGLGGGG